MVDSPKAFLHIHSGASRAHPSVLISSLSTMRWPQALPTSCLTAPVRATISSPVRHERGGFDHGWGLICSGYSCKL